MELISLKRKLYKRTGIEENTRVNRLKLKKKITKKKRNNFPLETNKQSGLCVCGSFSKCIHLLCSRMHCCHCLWIKKNAATPLSPWKVGEFFPIFYSLKKKFKKKGSFLKKSQFDKPPQNKQLYHFRSARSARTHKCREVLDRKKKGKKKEFIIHEEQL